MYMAERQYKVGKVLEISETPECKFKSDIYKHNWLAEQADKIDCSYQLDAGYYIWTVMDHQKEVDKMEKTLGKPYYKYTEPRMVVWTTC